MRIASRKRTLVFETDSTVLDKGKHRNVVVTARPKTAELRLKGTRNTVINVNWDAVYWLGAGGVAAGK
jgi:hypothetical protein